MTRDITLPGTIYLNRDRYWWMVILPGQAKRKAIPLKPTGAKYATKDKAVAEEIARDLYQKHIYASKQSGQRKVNTVTDLVTTYMAWAGDYYGQSREPQNIRYALTMLIENCPNISPEDFGPLKLKEIRQKMIELDWSRKLINQRVGIIKRMFRWATSEELVPVHVHQGLQTIEGLKWGRSGARETEPVKPVAAAHVRAVLPFASPTVAAMIELQLLTGMRSGELIIMRPCDIETSGKIWLYKPRHHKTSYLQHDRLIAIGPKAQEILKTFLKRKLDDYCFSPAESVDQFIKRSYSRGRPRQGLNNHYTTHSYANAVRTAIRVTNKAGKDVPYWTPHQLRHTAATRIRKEFGLDAARAALGHRNLRITDDYAELDKSLACQVADKMG